MSHTSPQPWRYEVHEYEDATNRALPKIRAEFPIYAASGFCIAVVGNIDAATELNDDANARLIAAAPRMLQFIETWLRPPMVIPQMMADEARAFLREIEGVSP